MPAKFAGITRCRPLLGTYVEIGLPAEADAGADDSSAEQAIDAAFAAIALCAQRMSFHERSSDLSQINRAAEGVLVEVHPWTAQVLARAIELFELTDGVFDAGVGAQLVGWGMLPAPSPIYAGRRASLSDIECLADGRIRIHRASCIDLGGIAKGFAVDRAIEALSAHGIEQAIVNAGGDLRVLGDHPHDIHVRHPASPSVLVHVGQLANGALATSAPYFSRQSSGFSGAEVCALVDAHSREPLLDTRSYTVIAPECCVADALTKVLAAGVSPDADCFRHYQAHAVVI